MRKKAEREREREREREKAKGKIPFRFLLDAFAASMYASISDFLLSYFIRVIYIYIYMYVWGRKEYV